MSDALTSVEEIKNQMRVQVGSREFKVFESMEFVRTMDTGCDALTITSPWTFGVDPVDNFTKPFSYADVNVFIGLDPLPKSKMILYTPINRSDVTGSTQTLECFSKTADIIDSTVQLPYEMNNVTLLDRCTQQCAPFGITVEVDPEAAADIASPFKRVDAEATEKIFEHLSKLSSQKGCLLSCTKEGNLYITKAHTLQAPVGTLIENQSPETEVYEMRFDGRNRYQKYDLLNSSAGSLTPQLRLFSTDAAVSRYRNIAYKADDNIPGENLDAAIWRRNKAAADALSIDFPVNSWYAPNDTLWEPNTTVIVISQTMGLLTGFTFLITQVKLSLDSGGNTGVLTLRPPQLYTKDPVILEPWT